LTNKQNDVFVQQLETLVDWYMLDHMFTWFSSFL